MREQVISQDTSSELESPTPVRQRQSSRIWKQPEWFSRHPEWSSFSQSNKQFVSVYSFLCFHILHSVCYCDFLFLSFIQKGRCHDI